MEDLNREITDKKTIIYYQQFATIITINHIENHIEMKADRLSVKSVVLHIA